MSWSEMEVVEMGQLVNQRAGGQKGQSKCTSRNYFEGSIDNSNQKNTTILQSFPSLFSWRNGGKHCILHFLYKVP